MLQIFLSLPEWLQNTSILVLLLALLILIIIGGRKGFRLIFKNASFTLGKSPDCKTQIAFSNSINSAYQLYNELSVLFKDLRKQIYRFLTDKLQEYYSIHEKYLQDYIDSSKYESKKIYCDKLLFLSLIKLAIYEGINEMSDYCCDILTNTDNDIQPQNITALIRDKLANIIKDKTTNISTIWNPIETLISFQDVVKCCSKNRDQLQNCIDALNDQLSSFMINKYNHVNNLTKDIAMIKEDILKGGQN